MVSRVEHDFFFITSGPGFIGAILALNLYTDLARQNCLLRLGFFTHQWLNTERKFFQERGLVHQQRDSGLSACISFFELSIK